MARSTKPTGLSRCTNAGTRGSARPAGAQLKLDPAVGHSLGFLGRLLLGFVVGLGLLTAVPWIEEGVVLGTVTALTNVLRLLHVPVTSVGNILSVGLTSFTIVPDCTPLIPTLEAWAAIAAYPARPAARIYGLAAAAVLLWLYNLARIMALFAVMARWPDAFDFVHVYLWQTVTLGVVIGIFLGWLRWVSEAEARRSPGQDLVASQPQPAG